MSHIAQLLQAATVRLSAESPSAQLDAEVLLASVLGRNRSFLRAWPEKCLEARQIEWFQRLVEQRVNGVPVAYLIGEREFWSRVFVVTRAVLIPRPETELLVEQALALIDRHQFTQIADLGTGSGAIAVTLAAERPMLRVLALDASFEALGIARTNALKHTSGNVDLVQSDWLAALSGPNWQLIVANPPYIADDDPHLTQGDVCFEPLGALVSGVDGLHDCRRIIRQARRCLAPGGYLMLEHGYDQAYDIKIIFESFGYSEVQDFQDLQGHSRLTQARWD